MKKKVEDQSQVKDNNVYSNLEGFEELVLKKLEKLDKLDEKLDRLDNNMVTREDLDGIVEGYNLATKDDLKQFATKEDLKQFATKEDLNQYATKDDLHNEIEGVKDLIHSQTEFMLDNFYTKDESDERFVNYQVFNDLKEKVNQISDHLVGLDKFIKHEFMLLKQSL